MEKKRFYAFEYISDDIPLLTHIPIFFLVNPFDPYIKSDNPSLPICSLLSTNMKFAGASRVGGKEWIGVLPEGKRFCTMQGDPVSPTHKPDFELRKGIRAHCLNVSNVL